MKAQIFHNPSCGTSRNVLALLRHFGFEVEIIDYLLAPPDQTALGDMIANAGLNVRDAIRAKEPEYLQNGLDDLSLSDPALLDLMIANPILINRPFVITDMGTRLARPSEVVLEIIPQTDVGPFVKEDGTSVRFEEMRPLS